MVHYYRLELDVIGPVLTKSSLPGEPGLDAVALRDPDGALLLNGKHMEGRAKHTAYDLAELSGMGELKTWATDAFGPEDPGTEEKRAQWEPKRGDITFEDLRCCAKAGEPQPAGRDFRLKMDEERGTGEDRMLGVLERAAEHGERMLFGGLVRIAAVSEENLKNHAANLLRSLRWITSVGGEAGIGYGVLQSVRLTACKTIPEGFVGDPAAAGEAMDIGITFAAPFCLAAPQLNQNIYEGLDTVPGNAIAGAIMRALQDVEPNRNGSSYPRLRHWFNDIRFRHASPAKSDSPTRPMVVPLSWVSVEGTLVEAALTPQPALFKLRGDQDFHAPRFVHDWKSDNEAAADKLLKRTEVLRELRTYTQIDRSTGVAKDEKLYSYELVRPEGFMWNTTLDLSAVKDEVVDTKTVTAAEVRKKLLDELSDLLNKSPLLFGKTSARAKLSLAAGSEPALPKPFTELGKDDLWIVLLLTPALILNASEMVGAGGSELSAAYKNIWQEFTGGQDSALTLVRYFTRESLVGGNYLYRRFQDKSKDYFPYLLTDAGSVFVLSSKPEDQTKAQDQLKKLLTGGLPLPQWAVQHFRRANHDGDYWQNCPFLPQNGYGEIAVNRQEQLGRLPKELDIEVDSFTTVGSPATQTVTEVPQ